MRSSAVHSFLALWFLPFACNVFAFLDHHHAALHKKRLLFDPLTEPIDITGDHAWSAPAEGEQRGPCPGLNALANHGYISRDGIVDLPEVLSAVNEVYGMGVDLATVLATLGLVSGGAPVSLVPRFSIGGESKAVTLLLDNILGIAGDPQGLNSTHNIVEADSSPTRDDVYNTGDAWTMNMDKFTDMLSSLVPGNETIETPLDEVANFAVKRWHQSVATNPYFYYGPFTGLVGRNAGFIFIAKFFSNYSEAYTGGQLNQEILKSFYGVTGDGDNVTYSYGHERIPKNWYRRPVDYGLLEMNVDLIAWAASHPVMASIGGNLGEVNTFTPLDLSNLTGGVLDAPKLLEGNNLICFVLNTVKLAAPSFTNNLFATLTKPLNLILDALSVPLLSLDCPSWEALQAGGNDLLEKLSEYQLPGSTTGPI